MIILRSRKSKYNKKKWFLVAHAPVDIIALFLLLIAIVGLFIIRARNNDDPTSNIADGSLYLAMLGSAALFVVAFVKIFVLMDKIFGKKRMKETDPRPIGFFLSLSNERDLLLIAGNIFAYIIIQLGTKLIAGELSFQVAAVDVVLFNLFAAIVEEWFFRGAIIYFTQTLLYLLLQRYADGKELIIVINIVCILFSGIAFLLAHQHYLDDPVKIALTLMGGLMQAYFFISSKSLLGPILAHGVVNFGASGGVIQGA